MKNSNANDFTSFNCQILILILIFKMFFLQCTMHGPGFMGLEYLAQILFSSLLVITILAMI